MKIPARPPDLEPLLGQPEVLGELFEAMTAWLDEGTRHPYRHWDEVRRRPPPAGMTRETFWAALKIGRGLNSRPLPLRDAQGRRFVFGVPDEVLEGLAYVDRNAAGEIARTEAVTNAATRDQYLQRSLLEEAITSSQLEGAATTREVAKEMIRTRRAPRTVDERMILNNFRAMQHIRELLDEPLTPALVCRLQAILTEETLDKADAAGRLRRSDEGVEVVDPYGEVLHRPPPAETLPERLEAMCAFANGESPGYYVPPVVRAILLHFWLAYDHPFVDGNGRTARALFYWSMLKQGFWLAEFLSISRILEGAPAQYGRAFLLTETDDNDTTYFLIHQLGVIKRAIEDLHVYLDRKLAEQQALRRTLRGSRDLNHRQVALVQHALTHPDTEYTAESHRAWHNVALQTARNDLEQLVARDLFDKTRRSKAYVYSPLPDLAERLRERG